MLEMHFPGQHGRAVCKVEVAEAGQILRIRQIVAVYNGEGLEFEQCFAGGNAQFVILFCLPLPLRGIEYEADATVISHADSGGDVGCILEVIETTPCFDSRPGFVWHHAVGGRVFVSVLHAGATDIGIGNVQRVLDFLRQAVPIRAIGVMVAIPLVRFLDHEAVELGGEAAIRANQICGKEGVVGLVGTQIQRCDVSLPVRVDEETNCGRHIEVARPQV